MADVPYSAGAGPSALPDSTAPDVYQRIEAHPDAFGAAQARGLQELGQGLEKAGQFYGQAAADDATNNLFDKWNKRLYGDPSAKITGPDGQEAPDTGFMGLRGRAALDARKDIETALDNDLKEIRSGLISPEQQHTFDMQTRRYRQQLLQHVGSHADTQATSWYGQVNSSSANLALTHIAQNADNEEEFKHGFSDLLAARVKDAQLKGGGTELVQQATQSAMQDAWKARLNAIAVTDPARAMRLVEANKKDLGTSYDEMAGHFRARADEMQGQAAATEALKTTAPRTGVDPVTGERVSIQPGGALSVSHLRDADAAMRLTQQERALYERHLGNLTGAGGVNNSDGSRSTLFATTVNIEGKEYIIPTVYDGKKLSVREAVDRARAQGLDKFPSYANNEEAQRRYKQLHSFMEKDTEAYQTRGAPRAQIAPTIIKKAESIGDVSIGDGSKGSFGEQCAKGVRGFAGALMGSDYFKQGISAGGDANAASLSGSNEYLQKSGLYMRPTKATGEQVGNPAFLNNLPIGTVISAGGGDGRGHVQIKVGDGQWASDALQGNRVLLSRAGGTQPYDNFTVHVPNGNGMLRIAKNVREMGSAPVPHAAATPQSAPVPGYMAPAGNDGYASAAGLIRHFEGYRDTPYWDVNHHRVGYGSDTVTTEDGKIVNVAPGMKINRADAERDLDRRIGIEQIKIQKQVGVDAWNKMSAGAQAALTSVAYNYGHLPDTVAAAVRTGDRLQVSAAILDLRGHNGGQNAKRRTQEAAIAAGGPLPAFGNVQVASLSQGNDASPSPTQASPTPPDASTAAPTPPPAPPPPPPAPIATLEDQKASAIRAIMERTDLTPNAQRHAIQYINQHIAAQQVADAADEKAKKDANDKAAGGYVNRMLTGNVAGITQQIANDPNLTWQTKEHLAAAAEKWSGSDTDQELRTYGPGFWSAYKQVIAPPGTEGRIADPTELLSRAGPGGDLTLAGVQKLSEVVRSTQRSVNDSAVHTAKVGLMSYAKSKLSFDQEMLFPGAPPLKDHKGEQIFQAQFIPKFEAAFDAHVKAGKDPWEFLQQANVDKMIAGMRSPRDMAADRIAAQGEAGPLSSTAPALPPPPEGANAGAWTQVMAARPYSSATGAQIPAPAWAQALTLLLSNPSPENIARFDASPFGKAGFRGAALIEQLKAK